MASCSLGVPKIKISAVDLSRVRSGSLQLQIPCNQRVLIGQRLVKYLSLRATLGSVKAPQASTVTAAESAATVEVEDAEMTKPSPLNAQLVPKPSEPIPAAVAASATTEGVDSMDQLPLLHWLSQNQHPQLLIRVGFFRRSKTLRVNAPSSCKEKDQVKEGQVLCYIEQLGGQFPIESDVTGEVVKILREDGGKSFFLLFFNLS
ncbi:hypothetical protein Bca52824_025669 [Brassica carinata]|uniref:Lipoyl-binding domain-containing protein n=1 Tax=Brassica carinata TaxID=52824 RepID=A0A8X7SG95_BRACI|nr:hypothetical protein Bca52824_025669 [Brassica carinata]